VVPAVARVSVELEPAAAEVGLNVVVTPEGRPEALKDTVPEKPPTAAVDTVVEVDEPALTEPEEGATDNEKLGAGFTVQVNDADPVAPVASLAETVTLLVPAAVGVPEISPVEELIDRPAGRPVAEYVRVCPEAESEAETCKLAAVPTVPVWLPGLVTVTVFCVTWFTVSVYVAEWLTEPDVQVMVIG
jgi:hypothetical protein